MARMGIIVLFLILEGMRLVFNTENNVCCGFVLYSLYCVEISSLYAQFLKRFFFFFNHKWVLKFVESILCIYCDDHMVLSFNLLIWCITLIYLYVLKSPCIHGISPAWSCCMIFLMYFWILFAKILLRIFASMFISDNFPFSFSSL